VLILTANKPVNGPILWIQLQWRRRGGGIASDWFGERACFPPQGQGECLSEDEIRQEFYFATTPGNHYLYVAEKMYGIEDMLPVA
jgi:hypothetical protein